MLKINFLGLLLGMMTVACGIKAPPRPLLPKSDLNKSANVEKLNTPTVTSTATGERAQ
ncbi:MAG: hypothetical protein VYC39_13400 [Myxococcota bacterium]|nr:hypothetical protein [Myxococcota bacterium]